MEVAVLYHAEAEWCGKTMLFQEPVHALANKQINCDILPSDVFAFEQADGSSYNVKFDGSTLQVEEQKYKVLVIPYCEYVRKDILKFALKCSNSDFKVIFTDSLPIGIADLPVDEWGTLLTELSLIAEIVALKDLSCFISKLVKSQIILDKDFPLLRSIQICDKGRTSCMIFNESTADTYEGWITIPDTGELCIYDAFNDVYIETESKPIQTGNMVKLNLMPGQSTMLVPDKGYIKHKNYQLKNIISTLKITSPWEISLMESSDSPEWKVWGKIDNLCDITGYNMLPDFSGTIMYKNSFHLENLDTSVILELTEVYETAEVFINSSFCGLLISAPYIYDVSEYVHIGENEVIIYVTNTLGHQQKDDFSVRWAMEPSGIIGEVLVKKMC